jgi:hypothetical protein
MGLFDVFLNVVANTYNAVDDLNKSQKRNNQTSSFPLPNNPAVTLEEFSMLLETYQKSLVYGHLPLFQRNAYTEAQCAVEAQHVINKLNIKFSDVITSEIQRLGKYGEYEKIILGGGDFVVKLSFWNKNIPDLKVFLKDSLEKVTRKLSPNYNV